MITTGLRIRGRVQGVGYRDALCEVAQRLRIGGWVRNRTDGSVEALLQGAAERVAEVIVWARRGPPASRVDELEIESIEAEPEHRSFERRPTV